MVAHLEELGTGLVWSWDISDKFQWEEWENGGVSGLPNSEFQSRFHELRLDLMLVMLSLGAQHCVYIIQYNLTSATILVSNCGTCSSSRTFAHSLICVCVRRDFRLVPTQYL